MSDIVGYEIAASTIWDTVQHLADFTTSTRGGHRVAPGAE